MSQKVLFVVGEGRSGSTLLARLLGEISGFCNVGECARYLLDLNIWEMDLPCSCGLSPGDCPFWCDIVKSVGADEREAATELLRLRHMLPWSAARNDERLDRLRETLVGIYRRVADKASCNIIIDSSKHPAFARLIATSHDVDLHVVHLVRDPRAVVSSRSKAKSYLRKWGAGLVVARWLGFNAGSETLSRHASSYRRVKYEQFVEDPAKTLNTIAEQITGHRQALDFLNGHDARISGQHALAGNPDKFSDGELTIRPATFEISGLKKLFTTVATLPLLIRYRYGIWPR